MQGVICMYIRTPVCVSIVTWTFNGDAMIVCINEVMIIANIFIGPISRRSLTQAKSVLPYIYAYDE